MNDQNKLFLTVIITRRKLKGDILLALANKGAHVVNTLYGQGTHKAGYVESILGLTNEQNRVVITALGNFDITETIIRFLKEDFSFDKPKTGIAFTIPVDKISI